MLLLVSLWMLLWVLLACNCGCRFIVDVIVGAVIVDAVVIVVNVVIVKKVVVNERMLLLMWVSMLTFHVGKLSYILKRKDRSTLHDLT